MAEILVQDNRDDPAALAASLGIDVAKVQKLQAGGDTPEGTFRLTLESKAEAVRVRSKIDGVIVVEVQYESGNHHADTGGLQNMNARSGRPFTERSPWEVLRENRHPRFVTGYDDQGSPIYE